MQSVEYFARADRKLRLPEKNHSKKVINKELIVVDAITLNKPE